MLMAIMADLNAEKQYFFNFIMKNNIFTFFTVLFINVHTISLLAQNMGVKLPVSTLPNTTLDVNGAVSLREGTALTLANGVNNDVTLTNYSLFRITGPTASFSLTGFSGGQNGRVLTLINATTQLLTLKNQTTSIATNQIKTGGSDMILKPDGVVMFIYNAALSKWVVSGGNGFFVQGALLNTFNVIGTTNVTVAEGATIDVPGASISFITPISTKALITGVGYSTLVSDLGEGMGAFIIVVDGVSVTSAFYSTYTTPYLIEMPVPCTQTYIANLSPGSHTIKLQVRNWSSNGTIPTNTVVDHEHNINVDAVAQGYLGAVTTADSDALKSRLSVLVIAQ
jgi:hypothetical protein